ncbi:Organic cation transporter-like protein [Eumeta japonica]|uniref:Organic cation transporter-like protein n=1 Tax=Eumeta variegata TaxID=151549 RepID=A0A4C1SHP4_EUMVA|nr:Organic cation transporter-like protein [Eumeta japonica]
MEETDIFASLVLQVIFGILAGIAPEYITYTLSRFIVGATTRCISGSLCHRHGNETHNKPTLETIQDGEEFGKSNRSAECRLENGKELKQLENAENLPKF